MEYKYNREETVSDILDIIKPDIGVLRSIGDVIKKVGRIASKNDDLKLLMRCSDIYNALYKYYNDNFKKDYEEVCKTLYNKE